MSVEPPDEGPAPGSVESRMDTFSIGSSLFNRIPPERIGLYGEYDYYGLSKRVRVALVEAFSPEDLRHIKVRQRGAMVVLLGNVPNRNLLSRIVQVAVTVEGIVGIEFNGVSIVPPSTEEIWDDQISWRASHQLG